MVCIESLALNQHNAFFFFSYSSSKLSYTQAEEQLHSSVTWLLLYFFICLVCCCYFYLILSLRIISEFFKPFSHSVLGRLVSTHSIPFALNKISWGLHGAVYEIFFFWKVGWNRIVCMYHVGRICFHVSRSHLFGIGKSFVR